MLDFALLKSPPQIDTLSELFVSWNATVNEVEDRVAALEREKVEKQRLGLIR